MADIFLSHSSVDSDTADRIKSWLERDRASWSVFLDKHARDGILAGQGWQDRLRRELQSCRLVVAIITNDWLASRWCFTEAVSATFRGKDFVGVVPGPLPDGALEVAPPIVHERQRQPLDLTTGDGWKELLHALDRSGLDPNQWFAIPEGVRPYPGFVAFEEKDAGVFFGRDQEITQYLDELNLLKAPDRAQALVISGGSGSGKSSLLKAGLIPRLRRQPDWLIVPPFDPRREPVHALCAALRTAAQGIGAEIDLPQKLPQTVDALTELLNDSLRAIEEKANAWLLLPLDQAEVLLAGAQSGGETDASRLLAAVGRLLAGRARKLVAVLTIRTEFMPALERTLPPAVRLHDRSLHPLTALSEVIEKPAARFGIELEEGLTGRMVEDTRGAAAVPLLAYTLRELYETYGDDKLLTVAEYEQLGGVEGAIEKKLHEALSDPEPSAQELAAFRRCFVRQLVRVDESAIEGERYLRTAVARDALPDEAMRLVDRLREARLLVGGDDGTIGIAHDRLIRNWADAPLQTWLADDSGDRKLIDTLKSFLTAHRDGGPLLSEKPLLDAKDFLERDRSLKDDEPELAQFIEDSIAAEQARLRRRKWQFRGAIAASLLFLALAGGAYLSYLEAQKQTRVAEEQTRVAEKQTGVAEAQRDRANQQTELAERRQSEAEEQTRIARENESRTLAALSEVAANQYRYIDAVKLAIAAWPRSTDDDRPELRAAVNALARAEPLQSETVPPLRHEGPVRGAAFNGDESRILTWSGDNAARLWDAATGQEVVAPLRHEGPVRGAAFNRHILTWSFDKTARLWDAATGKEVVAPLRHEGTVSGAAFNGDESRILTWSGDTARLWDAASGKEMVAPLRHEGPVRGAAFNGDESRILTWSWDNTARLWDVATGKEVVAPLRHEDAVFGAAFNRDESRILTWSFDNTARVWDAATGQEVVAPLRHEDAVLGAAFNGDASRILTWSFDKTARLWDAATGQEVVAPLRHQGLVEGAAFNGDGRRILTWSDDNTARLWDAATGQEVVAPLRHEGRVSGAAFNGDGSRILTWSEDNTARLWDAATGQEVVAPLRHQGFVEGAAFNGDGRRILTWSEDNTARLWDAATGKEAVPPLRHEDTVRGATFNRDESRILTWSRDNTARLWDAATGKEAVPPLRHEDAVWGAAFNGDASRILTWSFDKTARLWDAATGKEVVAPLLHEGPVLGAAFNGDESRILTWSNDNTARLWDISRLSRGNLFQIACQMLPDTDTTELGKGYGIAIADQICGPDTPAPVWSELVD